MTLMVGGAGLLSAIVFVRMTMPGVGSDILLHAAIAKREIAAGRWFSYTGWSPLLVIVSASGRLVSMRAASVVLLTLAVVLKAVLSRSIAATWGADRRGSVGIGCAIVLSTPVLALGVEAAHGATDPSPLRGAIYLGRFSAALWHNSTSIAAAPLVLVAAFFARRALSTPSRSSTVLMGLTMALCAAMKPNYALVALPIFVPVLAWRLQSVTSRRSQMEYGLWSLIPTAAVLAVQFRLVRSDPFIVQTRFTWDPLVVWRHYAPSPLVALGQSLAFPIVATCTTLAVRRQGQWWLWCSWAVMGVATAQVALLGERYRLTDELNFDGNWFWGAHAALLVLFVACGASLSAVGGHVHMYVSVDRGRARLWRRCLVFASWTVLCVHAASGAVYVWRLFHLANGFAT